VKIKFDPDKDAKNVEKHGVSLARAEDMIVNAVVEDDRFEYRENRFRGYGHIDGTAYCVAFTVRDDITRVISLRRAHAREMKRYGS
jgi:uncharacterized DUF497 family protein